MTAPDARQPEELREALARALHSVGYRGTDSAVAALLPVVTAWAESLARERAAEELRAMGDRLSKAHDLGPARRCRNRAAALTAADDQPVQP